MLFTDRGAGFFNPGSGAITVEYKTALAAHGLRAFQGDPAAVQPGMSDLMLHETAVAWIRKKERLALPARPWKKAQSNLEPKPIASPMKSTLCTMWLVCATRFLDVWSSCGSAEEAS